MFNETDSNKKKKERKEWKMKEREKDRKQQCQDSAKMVLDQEKQSMKNVWYFPEAKLEPKIS